jgi:hypothetical protein
MSAKYLGRFLIFFAHYYYDHISKWFRTDFWLIFGTMYHMLWRNMIEQRGKNRRNYVTQKLQRKIYPLFIIILFFNVYFFI